MMTTFNIDNNPTKYKEILDSINNQGHSLKSIHNPQTWRLSALSFALHLHDCSFVFDDLKKRWIKQLPFDEAWDVDFAFWKKRVWDVVNDIGSFTISDKYKHWEQLCEDDYATFMQKAKECLSGEIAINEILSFLKDKNTELSAVVVNVGEKLSALLAEIDKIPQSAPDEHFVNLYDELMSVYMSENADNPYPIDNGEEIISFERWIASKSKKQRLKHIPDKIKAINSSISERKFWKDTWEDCVDIENKEIDKEGWGRSLFTDRKKIIDNNGYPCKNSLYKCFSSLALCTHLWEYDAQQRRLTFPIEDLPSKRQVIIKQINELIIKGEWRSPASVDSINNMMYQVLGLGPLELSEGDKILSEKMWGLFEKRRGGDAVRVTWQNLIGYFDEQVYFGQGKGAPALCEMFFNNNNNFSNVGKGRPGKNGVNKDFKAIIPLLDKYKPSNK